MDVILFFAVFIGGAFLYYAVKKKLKQNVFQKSQYEEQLRLTNKPETHVVQADIATVMTSIKNRIPVDTSTKAVFKGGNYSIVSERNDCITYHHASKITTGGEGDEFTAQVSLTPLDDNRTQITSAIIRWREHDGVTRKAGIAAMQEFQAMVREAVRGIRG